MPSETTNAQSVTPRHASPGGPKTAEGKRIAARNATTHGLFARDVVLPRLGEDPAAYEAFLAELTNQLSPKNLLEQHYAEKIAAASWRLRRLHRWQAQLFEDAQLLEDEVMLKLDRVMRHETTLHRQIDTSVKMLGRELPKLFEGRVREDLLRRMNETERTCAGDPYLDQWLTEETRKRSALPTSPPSLDLSRLDTVDTADTAPTQQENCENEPAPAASHPLPKGEARVGAQHAAPVQYHAAPVQQRVSISALRRASRFKQQQKCQNEPDPLRLPIIGRGGFLSRRGLLLPQNWGPGGGPLRLTWRDCPFPGKMPDMADPLALVHHLCRRAVAVDDARPLLVEINAAAMQALGADRAFIALANDDTGELTLVATAGDGWTDEYRAMRLKIGEAVVNGHGHRQKNEGRSGITSHVAATGKPYITGNVDADPYYFAFFDDVSSEIAVPLVDGNDRVRGVINIESFRPDHFTDDHLRLLQSLADIAAMRLMMDGYRARETALVEIGKDLSAIADTVLLMRRVVDVAAEVLRFEDCSLFVLERDKNELVLQASRGGLAERIGEATYPLGEGLTGWVGQHGEVIRTGSPRDDPRWQGRFEEFPSEDIGAFLAVPIYGRHGVLGVLRVLRRKSVAPWFRREFTDDDESVLLTIASQLGTAIENGRILDRLVNTERMAAWGEMSARAAHMIGNRTFAIKGDLNELEYRLSEPDDRREEFRGLAEGIRRGIFRLEEILQEFRDFVRATQIALTDCSLNEIVQQCVHESFPKRSGVVLTLDLAPGLPHVLADPPRLKRAFSELIENAVSFLPDGGALTIRTTRAGLSDAQRLAGLPRSRAFVQVEFQDDGPGVPADLKDRIFTPFYTSRARGLGLGLSIVKGILEAHRGGIAEIGPPGEGAHFIAFLPAKTD